jgi:hypothetical protein
LNDVKGWDRPQDAEMRQAFKAMQYEPNLDSPLLSMDFVHAVVAVWEANRGKDLPAGILCTKAIDFCEREQKSSQAISEKYCLQINVL